jgi:hypothetical protein
MTVRHIHWQGVASALAAVAVATLCIASVLVTKAQSNKVALGQNSVRHRTCSSLAIMNNV